MSHIYSIKKRSDDADSSKTQNNVEKNSDDISNNSSVCETKRKYSSPVLGNKRTKSSSSGEKQTSSIRQDVETYVQMSDEIWQLYSQKKQTQEILERKKILRRKIHEILLKTLPNCDLFIVGSSVSGLGSKTCDMDLCLVLKDGRVGEGPMTHYTLMTIEEIFINCGFLKTVKLINAKVPILRFQDKISGIEMDLNINNTVGIRNTQLLHSYAKIDRRVPPLVVLIKLWACYHNINDAKNNTLSSYSLVLMVIHYLQYRCQPPVVPCLHQIQPHKYQKHTNVSEYGVSEDLPFFISENNSSVGQLFLGFLDYYANEFNFSHVISVRLGSIINKVIAQNYYSPKNMMQHWKYICIEEPFDRTNTAYAVFDGPIFTRIKNVFFESWNKLSFSKKLASVIDVQHLIVD